MNGSREALFAFAQAIVDGSLRVAPVVVAPNPFYQIYEGATALALGANRISSTPFPDNGFALDFRQVPPPGVDPGPAHLRLLARQPD